jgi:hypothetical protein
MCLEKKAHERGIIRRGGFLAAKPGLRLLNGGNLGLTLPLNQGWAIIC